VAAEEQAGKAVSRAVELEKQIDILNKEIEALSSQRTTLEARATKAEKKVQDLNLKLESVSVLLGFSTICKNLFCCFWTEGN
jgi:chromosome segregation ATPase